MNDYRRHNDFSASSRLRVGMLRDAARERYRIDVAEHRLEVQPDGSTIEGSKHSGTPEQCEECQTGIRLMEGMTAEE